MNVEIKPDLVLCLHFNAEGWGGPIALNPQLVPTRITLHVLVNGCYSARASCISDDDTRCHDLLAQAAQSAPTPRKLAISPKRVAGTRSPRPTSLPPYRIHHGSNAIRQTGTSPYVWTRNLLANRLYECPTVYLEPYVMNSPGVFARVQAGDYDGEREVAGARRPSIFREYADSVAAGVRAHFQRGAGR